MFYWIFDILIQVGIAGFAICAVSYLAIRRNSWRAKSALGIARRFSGLAAAIVLFCVILAIVVDRVPALDVFGWFEKIEHTSGSQFLGAER